MQQIIKKPLISEKSFARSAEGKFSFLADPDADKDLLRQLIEELYKVKVEKINTQNVTGKTKKMRGKSGKRDDFKKVIVTLKPGQKIALFDAQTEESKEVKKPAKKDEKKADKAAKTDKVEASKDADGVTTTIKKAK